MSTELGEETAASETGFPELTGLGTQIELLRIGRGLSKQILARQAGTSRQQLWRVMTGKSELTSSLRLRLADALQVDHRALGQADHLIKSTAALPAFAAPVVARGTAGPTSSDRAQPPASREPRGATIDTYLRDCAAIERTLATLPAGPAGRRLKRSLLNAIEECAGERGVRLVSSFFDLRGRVINDDV